MKRMKNIEEVSDFLTKIMFEMKDEFFAKELSSKINVQYKNYVKSYVILAKKAIFVEIISIKTDKEKAIEKILQMEHIRDNDVYPIGDGVNDVEMILRYDGYGMRHSEEIIYKSTTKLCNTVAELIEKISIED